MVGIAGLAATGSSLYSTISRALAGPSCTIGGITLDGFSTPAKVAFGGSQRIVEHEFPGGVVTFDIMGGRPADIEISGYFEGQDAVQNALKVDALRIAGRQVTFTWPGFARQVIIKDFLPEYASMGTMCPFRMTMKVVPLTKFKNPKPSLLSQLESDVSSALGLNNLPIPLSSIISIASDVLPTVGSLVTGSGNSTSAAAALSAASTTAKATQTSQDTALSGALTAAGNPTPGTAPASGMSALLAAALSASATTTAAAYIGRASINASSGAS